MSIIFIFSGKHQGKSVDFWLVTNIIKAFILGEIPYVACKEHIWGLFGRPYIFYSLHYILDL